MEACIHNFPFTLSELSALERSSYHYNYQYMTRLCKKNHTHKKKHDRVIPCQLTKWWLRIPPPQIWFKFGMLIDLGFSRKLHVLMIGQL